MTAILAFLLKIGFGGIVRQTVRYLERSAARQSGEAKLRADVEIAQIKAAVDDVRIMADLQREKMQLPWFWVFAAAFVLPLAAWWIAVIIDSIFRIDDWSVAALPPPLDDWAGQIIAWLFFVGGSAALLIGRRR